VCGRTALHDAVVSGSTAIVKVLVTSGIDINAKDFWVSVTYFASILWCKGDQFMCEQAKT